MVFNLKKNESESRPVTRLFSIPWTIYTVHRILQARLLEWLAFPVSRGSSQSGIEPGSPALQADSLPTELSGKAYLKKSSGINLMINGN